MEWVEVPVGPGAPKGASIVVYGHPDREAAMDLCGQLLMPGFQADGRAVQGPTAANVWPGEDAAWEEIAALPAPVTLPWSFWGRRGPDDAGNPMFWTEAEWAAATRAALEAGDWLRAAEVSHLGYPNAMSLLLEGRLRRAVAADLEGSPGAVNAWTGPWDVAVMPGFQDLLRVRRPGDGLGMPPEGDPGEPLERDEGSRWPYPGDKWMYRAEIQDFEESYGEEPADLPGDGGEA